MPFRYVCDPPFEHDVQRCVPATEKHNDCSASKRSPRLDAMLDEVIPWIRTAIDSGRL